MRSNLQVFNQMLQHHRFVNWRK